MVSRCAIRLARSAGGSSARAEAGQSMDARMRQMQKSLGGFRAALLIGWLALGAAGLIYAGAKGIPAWAALPVLAAFLIEYLFYLVPGFESAREWLASEVNEPHLGLMLGATALVPYLVY